jgi:SAM-dependent methyltransferase
MILCPDCRRQVPSLQVVACSDCGWGAEQVGGIPSFLSTSDRNGGLFAKYSDNYERIAKDDLEHSIQDSTFLQHQARQLRAYLGEVQGRSICDVGIGQGILLDLLQADKPRALTGVDVAATYLSRYVGRVDLRPVLANAENLPFRDEFDLVVAADVAEHVLNVSDLLVSIHESLVEGGTLAIRVPFKDRMIQYSRLRGCSYEMVHLRNFAKDNLVDLLSQFGFRIRALHYDGFHPSRVRGYLAGTRVGSRVSAAAMRRLPAGPDGFLRVNSRVGRALTTPLEITAIAEKLAR